MFDKWTVADLCVQAVHVWFKQSVVGVSDSMSVWCWYIPDHNLLHNELWGCSLLYDVCCGLHGFPQQRCTHQPHRYSSSICWICVWWVEALRGKVGAISPCCGLSVLRAETFLSYLLGSLYPKLSWKIPFLDQCRADKYHNELCTRMQAPCVYKVCLKL